MRNGLEYRWMSEVVVHAFTRWVANPNLAGPRRWILPSPIDWHPMDHGDRVIVFSTDWDPFTTSRAQAEKRSQRISAPSLRNGSITSKLGQRSGEFLTYLKNESSISICAGSSGVR